MKLTNEERESMLEAAKPLIKWMNENSHPHTTIHVDLTSAELTECVYRVKTEEFMPD